MKNNFFRIFGNNFFEFCKLKLFINFKSFSIFSEALWGRVIRKPIFSCSSFLKHKYLLLHYGTPNRSLACIFISHNPSVPTTTV